MFINNKKKIVKMKRLTLILGAITAVMISAMFVTACESKAKGEKSKASVTEAQKQQNIAINLEAKIPSNLVCMVNNAYMAKKQIPVEFEGKTYYGCCNMCVDKINNNREVRYAIDPVTGKEVDKATAFIALAANSSEDVLYFESEETFKNFKESK